MKGDIFGRAIAPLGLGTPDVESLTSAVRRLASDDVRRVSDLLRACVTRPYRRERNDAHPIFEPTRVTEAINGSSAATRLVVVRLESAFAVALAPTTMLDRDGAIEFRQAFRAVRAWCPWCLADDEEPYDRLIWALTASANCLRHRIALATRCGRCRRDHRPWHAQANPAACPHCGASLRDAAATAAVDRCSEIAALVIGRLQHSTISTSEVVAIFQALMDRSGGLRRLAALLGHSPSCLSTVGSGATRPHLELYLRALVLAQTDFGPSAKWIRRARPPPRRARGPTLSALSHAPSTNHLRSRCAPSVASSDVPRRGSAATSRRSPLRSSIDASPTKWPADARPSAPCARASRRLTGACESGVCPLLEGTSSRL